MGLFNNSTANTKIKINYDGKDAERGLSSLKKTIGTVVSVYAIKQLASYTWEMGKLGSQAELVEKNFANFAKTRNRSVSGMMTQLRSATKGMVDDMALQQKAMQAMIGGVKFDDLIVAMEYVTNFASATGQDVNVKMQSTMTGLARKSAQFLDDIGIQVMGSKDVVGDAIDQMKEKMDQFATSEDDASVKAAKLEASLSTLKQNIAKSLIPVLTTATDFINKLIYPLVSPEEFDINNKIKSLEGAIKIAKKEAEGGADSFTKFMSKLNSFFGGEDYAKKTKKDTTDLVAFMEMQLKNLKNKRDGILGKDGLVPTEPNATADDPDGAKKAAAAAREVEKVREDVLKESFEGRLQLAKEHYDKMMELAKLAGKGTTFIEQQYWNEVNKIIEGSYEEQEETVSKANENIGGITQEDYDTRIQILKQIQRVQLGEVEQQYREELALLVHYHDQKLVSEEEYQTLKTDIESKYAKKRILESKKEYDERMAMGESFFNHSSTIVSSLISISDAYTNREISNLDRQKLGEKRYNKERESILKEQEQQRRVFARIQQGIILGQTIMSIAKGSATALEKGWFGIPELLFVGAEGALQIAAIEAQNFQRGFLGESDRMRRADELPAMIGKNEAVIPGPQYSMHEDDVRSIVNNTANTAAGIRNLKGGSVVNQFYGLSENQIANVIRDQERRNYKGKIL